MIVSFFIDLKLNLYVTKTFQGRKSSYFALKCISVQASILVVSRIIFIRVHFSI